MYDDTAKKLAVKVIGTVESNLNYGAINLSDPITIGVAQWYGKRAAQLLKRMRLENPVEYYGVAGSLDSQIEAIGPTDSYWDSRYLTQAEANSLVGVLTRNQTIQNNQLSTDLDAYVTVFESYGFDADAHTDTLIYFMSMHHQGPLYALEIVETLDTECTLEEMHNACLTHVSESAGVVVLGKYGARYKTTYDLIKEADISGVDPVIPPDPEPVYPNGNGKLIYAVGDMLIVQFKNDEKVTYYPDGKNHWIPRKTAEAPPPPDPEQPPPPADNGAWHHPAPGAHITSGYGPRAFDGLASFHWGLDLSSTTAPVGVDIIAITDLVITVAYDAFEGGNVTAGGYVKGHTVDGAYTFSYNHMADGTVNTSIVGTTIPAGTIIGKEGATGNVTGTHLHLECYEGALSDPWAPPYGNPIDPLPVLRAHGVQI